MTGAKLHSLSLVDAEITRSLELSHVVTSLVDISSLRVNGPARLDDVLSLVGITGRDATFSRGLSMVGMKIVGPLDLTGARCGGDSSIVESTVEADLTLPKFFEGPLTISDVVVGRNLIMADGEFHDVRIDRLTVKGASRLESSRYAGILNIAESDFGTGFRASETLFSGDCEFRRVKFPGPDPMRGARFSRMPSLIDTNLRIPTIVSDDGSGDDDAQDK